MAMQRLLCAACLVLLAGTIRAGFAPAVNANTKPPSKEEAGVAHAQKGLHEAPPTSEAGNDSPLMAVRFTPSAVTYGWC